MTSNHTADYINNPPNIKLYTKPISKPWGGSLISYFHNIKTQDSHIGELVICSPLKQFEHPVSLITSLIQEKQIGKPVSSKLSFSEYWEKIGYKAMLQRENIQQILFPFMVKVIETQDPLSIQVHPSLEDFVKHPDLQKNFQNSNGYDGDHNSSNSNYRGGKYECWTILHSNLDAQIYLGMKDYNKLSDFISSIKNKPDLPQEEVLSYLQAYTPQVGHFFEIAPGMIHSTTGNILLYEVQETSDHTYRLYDFKRNRELHIEQAKKVIKPLPSPLVNYREKTLLDKGYSTPLAYIQKLLCSPHNITTHKKCTEILQNIPQTYTIKAAFSIITYLGKSASITIHGHTLPIIWGDSFLLWKNTSFSIQVKPPTTKPPPNNNTSQNKTTEITSEQTGFDLMMVSYLNPHSNC